MKPIVVLTDCEPEPALSSSKTAGFGISIARRTRVVRFGMLPPSERLRSIMYWYSMLSSAGLKYGIAPSANALSGISSLRNRRSRRTIN